MAEKYGWRKQKQQTEAGQTEEPSYGWRKESSVDIPTTVANNVSKRVETWLQNHQNYISNYQNRNANRKYNYEDSYVKDSADWLTTVSQQKRNFDAEADSILSYMDKFQGYLDEDWSKQVRDILTSARSDQSIVLENSTKDNEWWSNWANEDEYKTSQRYDGYQKKYSGSTTEDIQKALATVGIGEERDWLQYYKGDIVGETIRSDADFQKYASQGNTLAYTDFGTEEWNRGKSRRQRGYSSIDKYRAASLALSEHYGNEAPLGLQNKYDEQVAIYRTMKDEEFENLAYYISYDKEHGTKMAEQYVDIMEETLSQRRGTDIGEKVTSIDIPVVEDLAVLGYGALAGVNNFAFGVEQYLSDEELAHYPSTFANAYIADSLDGIGYYAHSAATNIGNMAPSILLSSVMSGLGVPGKVAEGVGSATMGVSAAGNAYKEALSKGYDKDSARTYSNLVGASEGTLQYLLGGVSTLGGMSGKISSKVAAIDNALLRGAARLGVNVVSEITEEEIQNFLEPAFRTIIFGEDYDAPTIDEIVETALVTMLSTGALEVGGTVRETRAETALNKKAIQEYGDKTDALIQEGLESDVNTDSYKLATKYQQQVQGKVKKNGKTVEGKAMTGAQIRNLLAANQEQITPKDMKLIQKAAEKRLTDLGQTENVSKVAELATRRATGQTLTKAEKSLLANSQYGARVANELIPENIESGDYTTDWAEDIGTRSVNAEAYNKKKIDQVRSILDAMANAEDPATYKSLEERVGDEEKLSVSKSGQATIRESGKTIELSKAEVVDFVKDNETGNVTDMVLKVDSKEVKASEIDYADEDQSYLFSAVQKIENIAPEDATVIVRDYDPASGLTVGEYLNGVDEGFTYGYYDYSQDDLKAGNFAPKLGDKQAMSAYVLGQNAKKSGIASQETAIKRMRTAQQALSEQEMVAQQNARFDSDDVEVYFEDGATVVKFDEHNGKYDEKRMAGVNTAKFLSKLGIGGKYYFYESYVNADGVRVYKDSDGNEVKAPNGMYKESDGSIHIDLNAGNEGQGTTLFTLGHELGHFIKQWSPAKFQALADFLIEEYGKTDMTMHERVLAKQKELSNIRGEDVSYDEAFEEVVADSLSTMFADGNLHEKLAKLKAKDKGLFKKIKQFFDNLIAKFRDLYAKLTPDQKDAQDVRQMKDAFDRIQTAFAEALVEASENFQSAEKNTTENGGVKFSIPYADAIDKLDAGTLNRTENTHLKVLENTPQVYIDKAGAKNLKIIMAWDIAYLAMKKSGDIPGNYHGLGPAVMKAIPNALQDPLYIIKQQNGRIIAVTEVVVKGNRPTLVSIELDAYKATTQDGENEAENYNLIVTIFDPATNYLKNLMDNGLIVHNKNNEDPAHFILRLKSLKKALSNDDPAKSSNENLSQEKVKVKNESVEAMDLEVDEKTGSVAPKVMNSERTWKSSDYVQERDKAAQEIAKAIGVSEKKAKDYIDSVNSIAKMIAEDRSRLDYFSSPGRSSFVDNAEYGGSFDFSTLCKKRRLLTGTFTAIQKALPNTALTADEILDIRNRMKEKGLEVSCGLCYVEGSRANMGQFAKEFLRLYKQYYPDAWQPNMADVNTPDGIEWVRINHPECYEQYEYFWNHYGTLKDGDKNLFASQQKPKLYQLHTEYKGEILNKFKNDDKVEDKNLNGGIRLQSFSDFEIVHLIDTMQIIMDMSRVGLAGQAYTKVPDFAWALGDTGLKINLSLIAKGVDANGKLIFDDVEGMPIAEAMKLRDRYSKNVGTILVAFNDEQLLAALADDRVDFIIPFHRSQWKKSQYEAMGLPAKTKDYTFMQNEKFIKPQYHEYRGRMVKDKATNYMPNEYWDFSKSGKENAEAYLEMCARNNKRPKFYKLLTNNGDGSYSLKADGSTDGYWKLLIDFKMYDNEGNGSPQMAVKPDFNMEEATRMLNDYSGGHSNFPVAQGVVDGFVKDYKASHKGQKFSDRDSKGKQLTEDQLEYFEKSMARDRDGSLQVVYHGGTVKFEFDTSRGAEGKTEYGPGAYFTESDFIAKQYSWARGGNVKEYYLNIERMFDDTDMAKTVQLPQWQKLEQILQSNGIDEKYIQQFREYGFGYMRRYLAIKAGDRQSDNWAGSEQMNAMLREAGFDGVKGPINDSIQYVIFTPNQAKLTTNEVPSAFYDTRYSERTNAPVFYSQMGKVVEEMKQEKFGASSVISMLRGRGVKAEEIRWSGIQAFLDGKKSVTKSELLDFIKGSMLHIEEENRGGTAFNEFMDEWRAIMDYDADAENVVLDDKFIADTDKYLQYSVDDGNLEQEEKDHLMDLARKAKNGGRPSKWDDYKLDGGENYRELVFKMPGATHSNDAMQAHWGRNAQGVLAHARMQDFETDNGKMLFIEEIQSDWHNEGHQKGYIDESKRLSVDNTEMRHIGEWYYLYHNGKDMHQGVSETFLKQRFRNGITEEQIHEGLVEEYNHVAVESDRGVELVPDAPFKSNYHEYVLKRLLRMAAEEGYDSIGWTTADIQSERWSDDYAEGYRIEYDQDIPKFLKKYGKQWGATVSQTELGNDSGKDVFTDDSGKSWNRIREWYDSTMDIYATKDMDIWNEYIAGRTKVIEVGDKLRIQLNETGELLEEYLKMSHGSDIVWSMDITPAMKKSVLEEGQTLYSERTGDSVSNRSMLANAFETLSQNSEEYKMIQEYKSHVAELNSLEAKLSDFNQQIRELRFDPNTVRDAEKLARLEDEARKIAEAINKHDKRLLNLEASEPLRKVIERERAKASQKTKDHVKQIQQNKKVRAEQTELRHKIRKTIRDLDKILNRGNKKLNVKEDVQAVVATALKAADILFTDNYGNYDMLRNGLGVDLSDAEEALVNTCTRMLKDLDKMPTDGYDNWQARQEAENRLKTKMSKLNDVFARERKRLNNTTVSSILGELADAYATLENSEQSYVQGAYNEAVHNFLKNLQSEVGGAIVKDMTKAQLEAVHAAYTMVLTTVRKANELFNKDIKMSREQLGNAVIEEVIKAGGVHGLWTKAEITRSQADWNNMKPIWVANRIGSESFAKLMQGLFEGQYNFAKDIEDAKQFKLSMDEKYHPRNWDKDKLFEFESSTGKKFSLNLQQIMSLYAFSKREQAYSHLLNGGFVFDGNSTVLVDEKGIKRTYIHNGATSYKLNEATLNGIINSLTAEQKSYVDDMQAYLSDVMGAKGNEVSMKLYGIQMFKEKFYFPLRSSGAYMERAKEAELKKQQGQINLVNSSFTHSVKPQAKNPIILSGFMDVWAEHCNEMSMYHSMVLPMEDFRKVYNYSTVHDESMDSASVFQTIQDAYGSAATSYIDQLYRELNASATVDPRETPFKKMISKFKKAAVMLSGSVVVQQFSSVGRAYAVIDPKYFIGTKVNSDTKLSAADEMKKYAPVAIIKEMGGFDTGTKGSAKSYIMAEQYGKGERIKGLMKDEQYRGDIMGYAPAKADEITWCAIWEACKRETKAKNQNMDVKSEEFLKLAGERFSEVIEKTQVYDSVLARSANMRSKSAFMQMATAFMAEPTTTVNLLEDAIRSGKAKNIARAFGAVAVSIVLNNALASVVYAMRDDDDDETFVEKYFQSFTSGMIDDINPMSYYPFLKDVYSLFQGYDVERADMSVIADLRDAVKKAVGLIGKDTSNMDENELAEHWRNVNSIMLSVLDAGCSVFGVPVKNVRRDVNGMINAYTTIRKDLSDERDNTWNSFWDKVGSAAKDTLPVIAWTKDGAKQDKLYEAIMEGDKSYLTRLKSTYKTDTAYENAVRKALRENDPRIREAAQARYDGKVAEYKRIFREIQNERKFSFDDIMSAINSEESAIKSGVPSDKAKSDYSASDFVDAVILGDTSTAEAMKKEIISTKVANGKTKAEAEKQFASAVYSNTRNAFDDGFLDQAGAKNMLTKYGGKDAEEAAAKVSYWAFCKAHPQYDLSEANVDDYHEIAEPAGISLDVFVQYLNGTKGLVTKYDAWGDVEVSKKEQVLEVIDSLPLTWEQKDALYLAAGYSEDNIWDVPW